MREISADMVERAARSLAYDVWPLARDDERQRWAEQHWREHLLQARNALAAARVTSPITPQDRDIDENLAVQMDELVGVTGGDRT